MGGLLPEHKIKTSAAEPEAGPKGREPTSVCTYLQRRDGVTMQILRRSPMVVRRIL